MSLSIIAPEIATGVWGVGATDPAMRWYRGTGDRKLLKLRKFGIQNDGEQFDANTAGAIVGDGIPGGWVPDMLRLELWDSAYAGPVVDISRPWPVARATMYAGPNYLLSWFSAWQIDITGLPDGRYTLFFSFDPKVEGVAPCEAAYPIVLINTDVFYLALQPQALPPRG